MAKNRSHLDIPEASNVYLNREDITCSQPPKRWTRGGYLQREHPQVVMDVELITLNISNTKEAILWQAKKRYT